MSVVAVSGLVTGIAVPGLLALGGFIAWAIRSTIEDYREAERQITAERRQLYQQILEPFLIPLIMGDPKAAELRQQKLLESPQHKRAVYELTLYASDAVVRAFGDIINSNLEIDEHGNAPRAMVLWARLMLAIRKSVGNKGTQLGLVDMLRPTINDLDDNAEMVRLLKAG